MSRKGFVLFFFLAVALLVYSNSLHGVFVYDDFHTIQQNPFVHDLRYFFQYFMDGRTISVLPENSTYRPLSSLTYALCWAIGQGKTWPFHVLKITEHALVAWLIFLITAQLLKTTQPISTEGSVHGFFWREKSLEIPAVVAAFLGALFFLVHPGLSESVNYISATSSLQCALFYLCSFYFFMQALSNKKKKLAYLLAMTLFFFLSVLTKEEGITLPFAAVLYVILLSPRPGKKGGSNHGGLNAKVGKGWLWVKHYAPVFILLALVGIVFLKLYFSLRPETAVVGYGYTPRWHYFFTQIRAWVYYFFWIFKPWGYAIEHLDFGFSTSLFEGRVLLSLGLVLAACACCIWTVRQKSRSRLCMFLVFCFAWYVITLLPASSIMPLAEPINEHRYYLSYTLLFPGLVTALLWGLSKVPRPKNAKLTVLALCAVLAALAVLTRLENKKWQSTEGLWSAVVKLDPSNGRAYNNLGYAYLGQGLYAEALDEFKKCAKAWQNYKYCFLNQHIAYLNLNQIASAQSAIERAFQIEPSSVFTLYYFSNFKLKHQQNAQAALEMANSCDQHSGGKYVPCLAVKAEAELILNQNEAAALTINRGLNIEPSNQALILLKRRRPLGK